VLRASVLQRAKRDVLLIKDRMSEALGALGPQWAASLAAGVASNLVATALAHLLFTRLPPAFQSRLRMSIETFEPYGGGEQTSSVSLHLGYSAGARMAFHMRHDAEQGLTFQNASFLSAEDTTRLKEVTHYDPQSRRSSWRMAPFPGSPSTTRRQTAARDRGRVLPHPTRAMATCEGASRVARYPWVAGAERLDQVLGRLVRAAAP